MTMDVNEAVENWERGDRRIVRRACNNNKRLLKSLQSYLSAEDYANLEGMVKLNPERMALKA